MRGTWKKTKVKRVPRVQKSSTRRSTCACGKFTHHFICGGISGQRTQKKPSPPASYICQHMDLPTHCANISRSSQRCAGASWYYLQQPTAHTLSRFHVQWHCVGILNSAMVEIYTMEIRTFALESWLLSTPLPRGSSQIMSMVNARENFILVEHFSHSVYTAVKGFALSLWHWSYRRQKSMSLS